MSLFGDGKGKAVVSREGERKSWALSGLKVLLAEDDEIIQQVVVELLESEGVSIDVTNNGQEAVDKLAAAGPDYYDVVFMDLQMPVVDGYQAIARVRADKRFDELPVIALTAHALAEDRQRCLESGMQDHVTKPIDPEALYQVLVKWGKRRGNIPVRTPASAAARIDGDEEIPEVEGLDVALGLKCTAGNKRLYLSILRKYVDGQERAMRDIKDALAAGDRGTAERLAHTVKGVSGNIGATAVQQVYAELEHAIRAGNETPPLILRSEEVLQLMMGRLKAALADKLSAETTQAAVGMEESARVLKRMRALLVDHDADVLDVVREHSATLLAVLRQDAFDVIEKAINNFEFEAAVSRLDAAMADNRTKL